jgi:lysyl-tRNA synthetase class I
LIGWLIELTIMEVLQISSKELISYTDTKRKPTKHGKHKPDYYAKNKEKFLLSQKKYRLKLKTNKPVKTLSEFQQKKQKHLLKLLVNHRSFVPVPTKLKHPIIKN